MQSMTEKEIKFFLFLTIFMMIITKQTFYPSSFFRKQEPFSFLLLFEGERTTCIFDPHIQDPHIQILQKLFHRNYSTETVPQRNNTPQQFEENTFTLEGEFRYSNKCCGGTLCSEKCCFEKYVNKFLERDNQRNQLD